MGTEETATNQVGLGKLEELLPAESKEMLPEMVMEEMKPLEPAIVYTEEIITTKDCLMIKTTPDCIVPVVETINIAEVKNELERSLNALKQWQAKVEGLQAIVDKYEANYVPVEEIIEPINEEIK